MKIVSNASGRARLVIECAVAGLVAETEIAVVDAAAERPRPAPARPAPPATAGSRSPGRRFATGAAASCTPASTRKVAVWSSLRASWRLKAKSERLGARLHPLEMALELEEALARIEAHRLDEVEAPAGLDEAALGQAFAPFRSRVAVGDDARAQADPRHRLAAPHHQSADGDVQRGVAVRRNTADRAGIEAARAPARARR